MTVPYVEAELRSYVVCGWLTPDYKPWADKLITSLDAHSVPHDIIEVSKLIGGWERNTMAKASHVLDPMDRHPGKVIVFLDVDCTVHGDLSPLAGLRGDVAFLLPVKRKASAVRLKPLSGTLVIRPTPQARRFVHAWAAAGKDAHWGAIDQHSLAVAMSRTPGVTIEVLEARWCGLPGHQQEDTVIMHDNASHGMAKLSSTRRRLRSWWQRWRLAAALIYYDCLC